MGFDGVVGGGQEGVAQGVEVGGQDAVGAAADEIADAVMEMRRDRSESDAAGRKVEAHELLVRRDPLNARVTGQGMSATLAH